MQRHFSISQAIKSGFSQTFNHFGLLLAATVVKIFSYMLAPLLLAAVALSYLQFIPMCERPIITQKDVAASASGSYAVEVAITCVKRAFISESSFFMTLSGLIALFLAICAISFFSVGFLKLILEMYDRSTGLFATLFSASFQMTSSYALLVLTQYVIISLGYLFFIIPGIFLSIILSFAPLILIDKKTGVIDALRMSAELTKGVRLELTGFWLAVTVLAVVGYSLPLAFLFVFPAIRLAYVSAYRTLEK